MPLRKSKASRSRLPVCFGTIEKGEWHVDFTLVPRPMRSQAATAFRGQIVSLQPGYGTMALIYHHDTSLIEVRRLVRHKFWIGDTVK